MQSAVPHSKTGGLSALGYGSVAGPALQDPHCFAEIVAQIRPLNTALQVTGVISCDAGRIEQWIEGPQDAVSMLWDRIRLDPRHRVHWASPPAVVTARHFPGSPMKLAMTTAALARLDPCLIGDVVALPDASAGSGSCGWPGDQGGLSCDLTEDTGARAALEPARLLDPAYRAMASRLANRKAVSLVDLLTGSEPQRARAQLESLLRQTGLPEAAALIQAVLDHLQAGWMAGLVSTLQRQLAATMLQSALRLRFDVEEQAQTLGCVLVSALPGTPDLCSAMLKVALLRRAGWSVRLLLPQTTAQIEAAACDLQPDLIVLAGSRMSGRQTELALLADLLPNLAANCAVPIIIGGKLAETDPKALLRLGAAAICGTLSWIDTIAAHLAPAPSDPRRSADPRHARRPDPALAAYLANRRAGPRDA